MPAHTAMDICAPRAQNRPVRTGYAHLPLHGGRAPRWLFERMTRLAREIVCHMVAEHGPGEVLLRLSDPYWFQALGCVLGFDWHSSGVTTTACGAIKAGVQGLEHELGLYVAGGKGATSRKTPEQILRACEGLGRDPEPLTRASRLAAKVDNTALQDGYQLYHHSFFFTRDGHWAVVQQGMNDACGMARRYHWISEGLRSFVVEPHAAVCCDRRQPTLNLVDRTSEAARRAITEIARSPDREVARTIAALPSLHMPRHHLLDAADIRPAQLHKVLTQTYENPPEDFTALLATPGLGPKTLRALALVAELVYGSRAATRDPAAYAFAHGGKDGTPYPVDRARYDQTIDTFRAALRRARLGRRDTLEALRRLGRWTQTLPAGAAEAPAAVRQRP